MGVTGGDRGLRVRSSSDSLRPRTFRFDLEEKKKGGLKTSNAFFLRTLTKGQS